MAPKSLRILLTENEEARKILAELGALLGAANPEDKTTRKELMPITADKTVRELAIELPHATRVFEKLGIDYCCGGHKSLEEACADANVAIDDLVRALEEPNAAPAARQQDWTTAPLGELVDHIITKHHAYVKAEVPRVGALIAKVVDVHGANHPELAQVRNAFGELAHELAAHLMKEEQILFPYIKQMAGGTGCGPSCFGTVQNPIRVMTMEHDAAGEKLREIRQATCDYALPQDACATYGALFSALQEFERDLHQHIHLENNILFPRALAMEH